VQTPPERGPNVPWNPPPGGGGVSAVPGLPPAFRSFAQDELTRAILVLILITFVGLIVVDRIVTRLAPEGVPAAGIPIPVAHVHPAFQDIPSRVQTNGKPLSLTLRANDTRVDIGYMPTRFLFFADPPNAPSITLCDSEAPVCSLPLDGTRLQRGTWTITVRVYDNTGGSAETKTRLHVT
jgi:hypothetical protein